MAAALCLWPGTAADAQDSLGRPMRALFRQSRDAADVHHRLDAVASVFGGWAESEYRVDTPAGSVELADTGAVGSGGLNTGLSYSFSGRRVTVGSSAGASYRRYPTLGGAAVPSAYAALNLTVPLGRRTQFRLSPRASYVPYYAFDRSLDPSRDDADLTPVEPELVVRRRDTYAYDVSAELTHQVSQRSTFVTGYSVRRVDARDGSPDLTSQRAHLRYSNRLSRHATLNLGYAFNQWAYRGTNRSLLASHDFSTGIGFARPLAGVRGTTVGFDFSSAVLQYSTVTSFRLNGGAFLTRELARNWLLAMTYRRGTEVLDGFAAPFFLLSDTVGTAITGQVARRLGLVLTASYSDGRYRLEPFRNEVKSLSASATSRIALTSWLGGYVRVAGGRFGFENSVALQPGLPLVLEQFTALGGLNLILPMVR